MSSVPPDDQPVLKALTTLLIKNELADATAEKEPVAAFVERTFPAKNLPFKNLQRTIDIVKLREYVHERFAFMPNMTLPGSVGERERGFSDFINRIGRCAKENERNVIGYTYIQPAGAGFAGGGGLEVLLLRERPFQDCGVGGERAGMASCESLLLRLPSCESR